MKAREVNYDGLVGPTHNYAGLALGDIASERNAFRASNPREAINQSLDKMALLMGLGLTQAVIPPPVRPNIALLKSLGFSGTPENILQKAYKDAPRLFAASYSASSMWTANSATVSPSADTQDGRVHFTPANLVANLHRAQETQFTSRILKTLFPDEHVFRHHAPLAATQQLGDEGAANHMRLCRTTLRGAGVEVFVYGRHGFTGGHDQYDSCGQPKNYPVRQTIEASESVARQHQLSDKAVVFAQQHPDAIDQGVFHNDVIAMSHKNVLIVHEAAFLKSDKTINDMKLAFNEINIDRNDINVAYNDIASVSKKNKSESNESECNSSGLKIIIILQNDLSIADAVDTYFFNSQLVSLADGSMAMIAPSECETNPSTRALIDRLINEKNPINTVHYVDCRQSMRNGGGPACLRLRVILSDDELASAHQGVILNDDKLNTLRTWANKHYRDRLVIEDLLDPELMNEGYVALDDLTQILKLGSIYDFQR